MDAHRANALMTDLILSRHVLLEKDRSASVLSPLPCACRRGSIKEEDGVV